LSVKFLIDKHLSVVVVVVVAAAAKRILTEILDPYDIGKSTFYCKHCSKQYTFYKTGFNLDFVAQPV